MYNKNSNDNIFLDEPTGELTFGKIYKLLKFSFTRAIVYILIACIIAGAGSLIALGVTKSVKSVSTVIEYNYNGISKGLTPAGDKFTIDGVKNANVLSNAIKNANLSDKEKLTANSLFEHIRTEGVVPADVMAKVETMKKNANKNVSTNDLLASITYYPNRYIIYLDKYDKLGLSSKEATILLGEVIKAHQVNWINTYAVPTIPNAESIKSIVDGSTDYEYVSYDDILYTQYLNMNNYFELHKDVDFVGQDGSTYANLKSDLSLLRKQFDVYTSYIYNKKAVKDSHDAVNILRTREANLRSEAAGITVQLQALEESINSIKPNSIITGTGNDKKETISYPPEYNLRLKEFDKLNQRRADAYARLSNATNRLVTVGYYSKREEPAAADPNSKIPPLPPKGVVNPAFEGLTVNEEVNAKADTILKGIADDFMDIIGRTEKLNKEYRESTAVTKAVTSITPVAQSPDKVIGNKVILGIFIIAIVIAGVAAIAVTNKKQKAYACKIFHPIKRDVAPADETKADEE